MKTSIIRHAEINEIITATYISNDFEMNLYKVNSMPSMNVILFSWKLSKKDQHEYQLQEQKIIKMKIKLEKNNFLI